MSTEPAAPDHAGDAGSPAADDPDRWLSIPRQAWLALHGRLFDADTIGLLERIGVDPGADALEVGAGSGSIAVWLARRVGPRGRVVATDVDTRFLDRLAEANLEVLRHDVVRDDFPEGSFDLVHCRALLVHLPPRELALERMIRWLKPGGTLIAEEPWIDVGRLSPDALVAQSVANVETIAPHIDCGFARRLPLLLRELGLERVEAESKLRFFEGGSELATYYRILLQKYAGNLVETGERSAADVERMLARYDDPRWTDCGWPRIAAWGRKPLGSSGWRQRLALRRRRAAARVRRDP